MEDKLEFDLGLVKVCQLLYDKKAEDIKILEVKKYLPQIADYFILATANSKEHMHALKYHIEEELSRMGISVHHVEGTRNARWLLMDYKEFIVHIMLRDAREFYRLEELWADVPRWIYEGDFKRED
ncbi:MAG: ribosome silencing factor [Candidatus Hydrothermia bacterium]|jgi:ribosome-associated protein